MCSGPVGAVVRLSIETLEPMRRMTAVAASITPTDIGDQRLRALGLHLERCNQGVLGLDKDVVGPGLQFEPHGELHNGLPRRRQPHIPPRICPSTMALQAVLRAPERVVVRGFGDAPRWVQPARRS